MFLNWTSVSRFTAAWVPQCQPESLARCCQDQDFQVVARAGNVMTRLRGEHTLINIVPVKAKGNTYVVMLAVQW